MTKHETHVAALQLLPAARTRCNSSVHQVHSLVKRLHGVDISNPFWAVRLLGSPLNTLALAPSADVAHWAAHIMRSWTFPQRRLEVVRLEPHSAEAYEHVAMVVALDYNLDLTT